MREIQRTWSFDRSPKLSLKQEVIAGCIQLLVAFSLFALWASGVLPGF